MFLNDSFKDFGGTGSIPDSLGIDHRDGPIEAEPKAICLGPCNSSWPAQAQFIQASLEVVPRGQALLFTAALGFRLVGTNEDVALDLVDVKGACDFAEFRIEGGR